MCWFKKKEEKPDVPLAVIPGPPEPLGTITGTELRSLLEAHFPQAHIALPVDRKYELTSCAEWMRFLKWYSDKHAYTWDGYDCDDFAWVMRAEALKWMHGKFQFGYIEAEGLDEEYLFPNHGFCFVVNDKKKVAFCDELQVAAPQDALEPFYSVRAHEIKT